MGSSNFGKKKHVNTQTESVFLDASIMLKQTEKIEEKKIEERDFKIDESNYKKSNFSLEKIKPLSN